MIFDGVRRWWESVIEKEKAEFAAARNLVREPALVLHANDDCPQCGAPAAMREIAGAGTRCVQCGFQPSVVHPNGSPNRAQLETWQDFDAEHKQKFAKGFVQALSRFGPRK
jgi:hypothetical protein